MHIYIIILFSYLTEDPGWDNCFLFPLCFLIRIHTTTPLTTTSRTANAAHIKPTVMATPLELRCEEPGDANELGWTESSELCELRQAGSGINLPESFNIVQAMERDIHL